MKFGGLVLSINKIKDHKSILIDEKSILIYLIYIIDDQVDGSVVENLPIILNRQSMVFLSSFRSSFVCSFVLSFLSKYTVYLREEFCTLSFLNLENFIQDGTGWSCENGPYEDLEIQEGNTKNSQVLQGLKGSIEVRQSTRIE